MTFKKYNHTNNAFCELLTDLQSSDNTMMLTGNFNRLPTSNFIVKISKYQGTKCVARENIYVANRNNNICTGLIRAYEKVPMDDDATEWIQQALNFSAGDMVECVVSSEIIKDLQNEVERKLFKNELRTNLSLSWFPIVENGNEAIKNIVKEAATQTDAMILKKENGDFKEVSLSSIKNFVSGGETTEMEIVEIPKEVTEKSFSNSIISSEGLSVDTNLNQTEDRYLKNWHTSSFYVVSTSNYKASDWLPKTYIYFNDNVSLSGMTFYCSKWVNVYIDWEEVFSSQNSGTQNIQFTERRAKVVCLEYVLTDTSSSQYISLSSFRISGKLKKHSFAAYSKLESWAYETFIKHTWSSQLSSSRSVVRDFWIVVEFPMNVTLNSVSTYSSITSEQARCTVYTEDNKKIWELTPKSGKMIAQTPIKLNKNTKYRMLLNSSENFWNWTYYYADISSSQWPFYEEKAKMMADFYKAGWINNSAQNLRVYEISSIDISFDPVLVLSKNDFYRYNFVWVFENPQIGQRYSIWFVDDTIVSGFKNLKKWTWYYLSLIPGVLSLAPTKDFQKMPAWYAVSENSMKITTKGSPQHTWYGTRFMGTGDIVYSSNGTLNTRTYAHITVDSYRNEYTYMSQTESKVEHGFSSSSSITL